VTRLTSDRVALPALWLALGLGLSALVARVRDWFDMTDEMRYERLAIAIARTHSLVPRVHGVDIHSYSQLYPLVIAPAFAHGLVSRDLVHAHVLGAWVMSSTCIPAFLLARRVLAARWAAYAVAALAVCMPWIVYSGMLMTEVAAYPAFVWALLGLQRALLASSWRRDLVALLAIAVAYLARAELIVLVVVFPLALLAFGLGRPDGTVRSRLAATVRGHALLAVAYLAVATGAVGLAVAGRLSSVAGVYGVYGTTSGLFPAGLVGSFAEHAATFSLAFAVLPFVVGTAWLLANLVRPAADRELHAFACLGAVAVVGLIAQATEFDIRYTGYVHDRFLVYLVPVVVIAALCAALDRRAPRWSLALPAAVVAAGFARGELPPIAWAAPNRLVQPDSPASILLDPIVHLAHGLTGARVLLAVVTLVATVAFALAAARVRPGPRAAAATAFMLVALPLTTWYVLARVFDVPGWSSRPLTRDPSAAFDWLDRSVGTGASVTLVPAPVSSDWFVSQQFWRDLEFWNRSVVRDAHDPGPDRFEYTGIWFPKLYIHFDPRTGAASASPTMYAVQSLRETRFRISGPAAPGPDQSEVWLIRAGSRWRADWLTLGAYDDGWTMPGVPTRIRVFATPGQRTPEIRYLTLHATDPQGRAVTMVSNEQSWRGVTPAQQTLRVCVPRRGFAEVRLTAHGASAIPGDARDAESASSGGRLGGVYLGEIALADEIGGPC
jgi:hypothetical protein